MWITKKHQIQHHRHVTGCMVDTIQILIGGDSYYLEKQDTTAWWDLSQVSYLHQKTWLGTLSVCDWPHATRARILALKDDWVNGGQNGLHERKIWTNSFMRIWRENNSANQPTWSTCTSVTHKHTCFTHTNTCFTHTQAQLPYTHKHTQTHVSHKQTHASLLCSLKSTHAQHGLQVNNWAAKSSITQTTYLEILLMDCITCPIQWKCSLLLVKAWCRGWWTWGR